LVHNTQDEDKQSKMTAQKTRKMSNTPVPVSYKTPFVLLIYTGKSGKFVNILQLKESLNKNGKQFYSYQQKRTTNVHLKALFH